MLNFASLSSQGTEIHMYPLHYQRSVWEQLNHVHFCLLELLSYLRKSATHFNQGRIAVKIVGYLFMLAIDKDN